MSKDTIDLSLGRRLRQRRRLLDLTQQELADGIGVTFQQIHKYECAANRMSAAMIWRLATFLGVEVGYFYAEDPAAEAAPAARTLESVAA